MRIFWLTFVVLLGACSGSPTQSLTAPCVTQPVSAPGGECPQCQTDSDCHILSNACETTAYCVHKTSSFRVNAERTCSDDKKFRPTPQSCRCLANICDWHALPAGQ